MKNQYKVVVLERDDAEHQLEFLLNSEYLNGWKFITIETEYTKFIVIFERIS